MTTKKAIKLAIADDHTIFKQGIKVALSRYPDIELIFEADNGAELLSQLKGAHPDVILLDLQMPVMDGVATLPQLKNLYGNIKVIILSMSNDYAMIWKLMELGASSYLTKNADPERIYTAIRNCHEQGFYNYELIDMARIVR